MIPPPVALGLTLCDYVIVEEGTAKASLIGTFADLGVGEAPSRPRTFWAVATLTDGSGTGTIHLVITKLDTDEEVYTSDAVAVEFPGKLAEVRLAFQLEDWSFPDLGWYQFTLLVDGEYVTQRCLELYLAEDLS